MNMKQKDTKSSNMCINNCFDQKRFGHFSVRSEKLWSLHNFEMTNIKAKHEKGEKTHEQFLLIREFCLLVMKGSDTCSSYYVMCYVQPCEFDRIVRQRKVLLRGTHKLQSCNDTFKHH